MEVNHRRNNSSGDKFSFPIFLPIENHINNNSFEFECTTTTPAAAAGSPDSPADHLFFNGRLLPHVFPVCQPTNTVSFSRSTSRTSSVSSKDSFMSSRSNSTNSRSSSARTSTSSAEAAAATGSERKLLIPSKAANKTSVSNDWYRTKKPVLAPHYGSTQRWQFIINTPAPPLKNQASSSRTRRKVHQSGDQRVELKKKKQSKDRMGKWFGWRFFRSFVSACKECHAIKPSPARMYLSKN